MFSEMVGAVVFPQIAHIVHQSVVPVEPEVEDDAVDADFEREPDPGHLRGSLGFVVREDGRED